MLFIGSVGSTSGVWIPDLSKTTCWAPKQDELLYLLFLMIFDSFSNFLWDICACLGLGSPMLIAGHIHFCLWYELSCFHWLKLSMHVSKSFWARTDPLSCCRDVSKDRQVIKSPIRCWIDTLYNVFHGFMCINLYEIIIAHNFQLA